MHNAVKHKIASLLRRAALALTLAAAGGFASAGVVHVAIDTSSFGAASGYLDMQLSASGNVPLATAVVSNMVGFGALDLNYGVTPQGGGFKFRNDTSNYLSHTAIFGGLLSFDLTFDGAFDPLTTYESMFTLSAYDEAFAPLGAFDPATGALATFVWTHAVAGDAARGVNLSDPGVTAVPEPADWMLMAIGLAAMALAARRGGGAPRQRAGAGMAIGLAARA
ncbi:NF038129 family PEP-CTERM protein [Pseudoduganella namucuonensis]|uniref:PEP-CTERM protein-sorting domain-containing protein n=1 Tax=Pseudoduganella namucuonensis TaxID=1035707 RepID=A0A1I7H6F4_9BURK|nr:NF038129 family PEP-CTERM protein [Pseudoduganella namucuonensis]SFU56327.1 PEP-CTERM protein-sorting domain-containing protein [Pseudoduganella namucuonensis]